MGNGISRINQNNEKAWYREDDPQNGSPNRPANASRNHNDNHHKNDISSGSRRSESSEGDIMDRAAGASRKTAKYAKDLLDDPKVQDHFPEAINKQQMEQISQNKDGHYQRDTVRAAKHFSGSTLAFKDLDTAFQAGHKTADGWIGRQDLETYAGKMKTREHVKALRDDDRMMAKYGTNITKDTLRKIENDEEATKGAKDAARYLRKADHAFSDIDVAHQTNNGEKAVANGRIVQTDLDAYLEQGNAGVTEETHGSNRNPKISSPAAVASASDKTATEGEPVDKVETAQPEPDKEDAQDQATATASGAAPATGRPAEERVSREGETYIRLDSGSFVKADDPGGATYTEVRPGWFSPTGVTATASGAAPATGRPAEERVSREGETYIRLDSGSFVKADDPGGATYTEVVPGWFSTTGVPEPEPKPVEAPPLSQQAPVERDSASPRSGSKLH